MASTTCSTFESQCREFAREFPTPNVLSAIALCESGRLGWEEVYGVFKNSLGHALETVA